LLAAVAAFETRFQSRCEQCRERNEAALKKGVCSKGVCLLLQLLNPAVLMTCSLPILFHT
jgi:hypothetical protein